MRNFMTEIDAIAWIADRNWERPCVGPRECEGDSDSPYVCPRHQRTVESGARLWRRQVRRAAAPLKSGSR